MRYNDQATTLVTEAFAELGPTKNPIDSSDEEPPEGEPPPPDDELPQDLIDVMNELKRLFPDNCRFANYRIDIKTISADTGILHIAPVPVCIIEKNWREF